MQSLEDQILGYAYILNKKYNVDSISLVRLCYKMERHVRVVKPAVEGPFLTTEVSQYVDGGYIGVYVLSRDGRNVDYVGRSDSDIQGRLITSISQGYGYSAFWFCYELSPMQAYKRECYLYHKYIPSDNTVHPAVPPGTMKDVIYYVGHAGIASDYPPCNLRNSFMYEIEISTNELVEPDLLFDISDVIDIKMKAVMNPRIPIFGKRGSYQTLKQFHIWNEFWGMRSGVAFAEPLYQTYASMSLTSMMRRRKRITEIPM